MAIGICVFALYYKMPFLTLIAAFIFFAAAHEEREAEEDSECEEESAADDASPVAERNSIHGVQ